MVLLEGTNYEAHVSLVPLKGQIMIFIPGRPAHLGI
jgi:hypothetical protein